MNRRHSPGLLALLASLAPSFAAPALSQEAPMATLEATRLYVEGALEESMGRDPEAYRLFHHAYLIDPESASILFALARVAIREGDLRLAVEHLRSLTRFDADHQPGQLLLGTVLELMNKPDEAAPHLERAVALDSLDAGAALALARHYERTRETEKALAAFLRARELDPGDDEQLLRIATLLGQLGRFAEAEPYLERLREVDPGNPTLALTWAWVQDELGRPQAAIAAYEEHLRLFPADAAARRRLVNAFVAVGQAAAAKPHAVLLYGQARGVEEARVLAGVELQMGDTSAAKSLAREVRAGEPGNVDAGEMALRILARCGEGALARDEMARLTQESPENYRTWLLLCVAHEALGERQEALAALRKGEGRAPLDSLEALLDIADGFSRLGAPHEADRVLAAARRLRREPARVWYAIASVRERSQDVNGAEKAIREVLKLEPENPQALNFLGYLYADHNRNLREALQLIRQALGLDPGNGYIVDSLGWTYFRLGELDSARTELERAIRLSGDDPVILEHLGDVLRANRDHPEANRRYRRALELDPDNEALRRKVEESR